MWLSVDPLMGNTLYYNIGEIRVYSKGEYKKPMYLKGMGYWSENTYEPSELIKGHYKEYNKKGDIIIEIEK